MSPLTSSSAGVARTHPPPLPPQRPLCVLLPLTLVLPLLPPPVPPPPPPLPPPPPPQAPACCCIFPETCTFCYVEQLRPPRLPTETDRDSAAIKCRLAGRPPSALSFDARRQVLCKAPSVLRRGRRQTRSSRRVRLCSISSLFSTFKCFLTVPLSKMRTTLL